MPRPLRALASLACSACAGLLDTAAGAQPVGDDRLEPAYAGEAAPAPGLADPALGGTEAAHVMYSWANVLHVAPVYAEVRVPQRVERCDEYERAGTPRSSVGSTMIGALIGGVIGNQIGSGNGRRVATAAGAVAGGAIGHHAGRREGEPAGSESRCHTVEEFVLEQQVVAYEVEYRYRDDVFISRLDYHPGDRVKIRVAVSPVPDQASAGSLADSP
jgi:uncharacterized protein YcfJ